MEFILDDYNPHRAISQRFENLHAYYLSLMDGHKDWIDLPENMAIKQRLEVLGIDIRTLDHDIKNKI